MQHVLYYATQIAFNMGLLRSSLYPLPLFLSLCLSLLASISTDKFILFMHFMYVLNSLLIALPIQKIAEIA